MNILDYWMTETVDVERMTVTKDAIGGQVNTWATWTYDTTSGATTAGLKCKNWVVSITNQNQNETVIGQPVGIGLHDFAFPQDIGAKIGDRIKHGGEYYQVQGTPEFYEHPAFPGMKLYVVLGLLKQS